MKEGVTESASTWLAKHLQFRSDDKYAAFSALYDQSHLVVFRYIYGLQGGPLPEVEDLTSETFFRAWRRYQHFSGDMEAAVGWLLQIARRLVIDSFRRQGTRVLEGSVALVATPDPAASPEEQAIALEQVQLLWQALHALPPEQRELIVLRYMLGWPVKRIAAQLNIPENTVSVTLRRILIRLRQNWPNPERS